MYPSFVSPLFFRGSSLFCFPKLTSLSSIPLWLVLSQILFDSLTRCLKEHPCNIPLTHSITEKLSSKLSFQEIWPVQFKFIPIGTGAEYQCSFNTLRTIALHRTLLYSNLLLLVDAWGVDFIIEHNAKKNSHECKPSLLLYILLSVLKYLFNFQCFSFQTW